MADIKMNNNTIRIALILILMIWFGNGLIFAQEIAGRGNIYTIDVSGELSDGEIAVLEQRGIKILDLDGPGAYIVRTSDPAGLSDLQFVHGVRKAVPATKISSVLSQEAVAPSSASTEIEITISLFNDTTLPAIRNVVASVGGSLKTRRMLYGKRVIASVPASSLAYLAEYDIVRTIEAGPREKIINNFRAARASNINAIRNDYGLTGSGVIGGIWDEGAVDAHPDLAGHFQVQQSDKVSDHATHVAGTIVGSGAGNAKAKGMAPDAFLYSFDFNGDVPTEMFNASKNLGVTFANNSWSYANGWSYHNALKLWLWFGDKNFGRYTSESASYDQLVEDTDMIILFAAGNDRADKGTTEESYLDVNKKRGSTVERGPDGPYMTIDITSSAKNIISVGAVNSRGKMTSFSSWGPTRDGRVKPEVVATGKKVTSTVSEGEYAKYSGTSMATPTVAGGVALLIEQYGSLTGDEPSAATIRALLAASSKDLGNKGPDYSYGFGLFDAACAARLIDDSIEKGLLFEDSVCKAKSARTKYYKFNVERGTKHVKIAMAWTDPAARPDAEITLVNDLDIRVFRPDGSDVHLPWVLDGENPAEPATTGKNLVDNIELVELDHPDAGDWIIEVTVDRMGKGSSQEFALVVNSSDPIASQVTEVTSF